MIGVILWRDVVETKAVIWCEDQGDLAYFSGTESTAGDLESLKVGDVVQFDVAITGQTRRAVNVFRLIDNWGTALGSVLGQLPQEATADASSKAKVIPFSHAKQKERVDRPSIRRHG